MKKTLKENKVLFVLALILLVAIIVIAFGLFRYFYGNDSDKYGNRLNNIENYEISQTIDKDISSLYETGVDKVTVDIKGKIIYIILDVSSGTSKDTAKAYALKALEKFTEEELGYYDIQFLITCKNEEAEEKAYPIEGYKNSSSNGIVWTNN